MWVDTDACPKQIREILLRTSKRLKICVTFVANQSVPVRTSETVRQVLVADGADVADNYIADKVSSNDIVVTQDIPLAARVIQKGAIAIGVRGELFDDSSISNRLATRNLMEQFRSAGLDTGGPKPFNQKDIQTFANTLDRTITKCLKSQR
ncbi:MAG: YaiI/YqxD family protein [Planctomycetota bacterium]